jgi:hypothetical protein
VPPRQSFYLWVEQGAMHGVISAYAGGRLGEPGAAQQPPYFRPGNPATHGQTSQIAVNTVFLAMMRHEGHPTSKQQ